MLPLRTERAVLIAAVRTERAVPIAAVERGAWSRVRKAQTRSFAVSDRRYEA